MRKSGRGLGGALLVLAGLFAAAALLELRAPSDIQGRTGETDRSEIAGPELRIAPGENALILNHLVEGDRVRIQGRYTNTGAAPVTIAAFDSSCACTVADTRLPLSVKPGETASIPVLLDLKNYEGHFLQSLWALTDQRETLWEIRLSGETEPRVRFEPSVVVLEAGKALDAEVLETTAVIQCGKRDVADLCLVADSPWTDFIDVSCPERLAAGQKAEIRIRAKAIPGGPRAYIDLTVYSGEARLKVLPLQLTGGDTPWTGTAQIVLERNGTTLVDLADECGKLAGLLAAQALDRRLRPVVSPGGEGTSASLKLSCDEPLVGIVTGVCLKVPSLMPRLLVVRQ